MSINRFTLPLLTLLAVTMVIGLYLHFVNGVRGTDQYWYLADTEALMTDQPALTNTVFAGLVLRQNTGDPEHHFLHNGPLLHINGYLARWTGAFQAWKLTNLGFFLVAIVLTGLSVRQLAGNTCGWLASLLYAVAPVNLWVAGNLLQETWFSALTATLLFLVIMRKRWPPALWLIVAGLFPAVLSHPIFALAAILFALQLLRERQQPAAAAVLVVTVVAELCKDHWFPSSFQPTLVSIVTTTVPHVSNMLWQLSDTQPSLSASLLWSKLIVALHRQFLIPEYALFYLLTNLAVVALIYLGSKQLWRQTALWCIALGSLAAYGALSVLLQSQPRYQVIIAPVAVAIIAVSLREAWLCRRNAGVTTARVAKAGAVLALAGCLALNAVMLGTMNLEGRQKAADLRTIGAALGLLPEHARPAALAGNISARIPLVYALRPLPVLLLDTDLLPGSKIERVLEHYQPTHLLLDRLHVPKGQKGEFVKTIITQSFPPLYVFETSTLTRHVLPETPALGSDRNANRWHTQYSLPLANPP